MVNNWKNNGKKTKAAVDLNVVLFQRLMEADLHWLDVCARNDLHCGSYSYTRKASRELNVTN